MKRLFDIFAALFGLVLAAPVLLPVMFLVWCQDGHSPFYIAERTGINGVPFRMVKLRSMVVNADRTGVDSTSSNDTRINPIGHFIRHYKLDELTQLWNVLLGEMSLVGPRPNVKRETELYTSEERRLLDIQPGITDFSSIVLSDEGKILSNFADPDIAYHQLIRPGKSKLGLFYIEKQRFILDLKLIFLTFVAMVSKATALRQLVSTMERLGAKEELMEIASRSNPLAPSPPPGTNKIITSRDGVMG